MRRDLRVICAIVVLLLSLGNMGFAQVLGYEAGLPNNNPGTPMQSGFYQAADVTTGSVPDKTHAWMHPINSRHGNTDNNHQLQIGASYSVNDRLFFRKIGGGLDVSNPEWIELATRGSNTFVGTQISNTGPQGNVLIGKNTQSNGIYRLDVAGKVRANEIVVNTTGADYVFEQSYRLPSLEEVEKHIKDKGCLPDVPSAKQMQEDGMGVGEMQTLLLQKVEELTLYVIEQQKRLDAFEKEIRMSGARKKKEWIHAN